MSGLALLARLRAARYSGIGRYDGLTYGAGTYGREATAGTLAAPSRRPALLAPSGRSAAFVAVAPAGRMEGVPMTGLATLPAEWEQGSFETLPLGVDMAPLLASGETISAPTARIIDKLTRADVSATCLLGSATSAGTVITAYVHNLQPRREYLLILEFDAAASKHWGTVTTLDCDL